MAIPVMLIVATIVFALVHLTPGNPAALMLGPQATPGQVHALMAQMGLTKPLFVQYEDWLVALLHGNLGESIFLNEPVTTAILQHVIPTLLLTAVAFVFSLVIGLSVGVMAARRRGSRADQLLMVAAMIGMSLPEFWGGLLLMLVFAENLRVLPAAGYAPPSLDIWIWLRYLLIPGFIMGFVQSALVARMTRATLIEVMGQDYIRTARGKGVSEGVVIRRHAMRNALVPIVTVVGNLLIIFLGGDIAMETIFTIPGVGYLLYSSVLQRDYPIIAGISVLFGILYVVVNVLIDLSYLLIDPRVRY